jgi:hypothetical protein
VANQGGEEVKHILAIPRAIFAIIAVLVDAVRGAVWSSKRRASSAALSLATSASLARTTGVPSNRDADEPVQPYPDEVQVEGRTIELPQPSFWPMVLAFGVTLLFFGMVTSLGISVAGAIVIAWAIAGWIGEIRHD